MWLPMLAWCPPWMGHLPLLIFTLPLPPGSLHSGPVTDFSVPHISYFYFFPCLKQNINLILKESVSLNVTCFIWWTFKYPFFDKFSLLSPILSFFLFLAATLFIRAFLFYHLCAHTFMVQWPFCLGSHYFQDIHLPFFFWDILTYCFCLC